MMYEDNDTLNTAQQNKNQSQADKSKTNDAMIAKLLSSVVAGFAVGAGGTFAADYLVTAEEAQEEVPLTEDNVETTADQQTTEPTIEERIEALEEKERMRERQEQNYQKHETERQHQTQKLEDRPEKKIEEGNVLKNHDVKIESVEERTLEDGSTVRIYSGTMDGHQAAFMADSNGRVVAAIVDVNDNGSVDDNEIVDMRDSNVTSDYFASCQVQTPDNELNVIAVEHDVEMHGETVDLALVEVNELPVMLVDVSQNGEVDLAIADQNHNGNIDEGEVQDVSDAHITMPTADDITENMIANVDDNTDDYSNNADVTVYDV